MENARQRRFAADLFLLTGHTHSIAGVAAGVYLLARLRLRE